PRGGFFFDISLKRRTNPGTKERRKVSWHDTFGTVSAMDRFHSYRHYWMGTIRSATVPIETQARFGTLFSNWVGRTAGCRWAAQCLLLDFGPIGRWPFGMRSCFLDKECVEYKVAL